MSASYTVDLARTVQMDLSIHSPQLTGVWPGSGAVVGANVDMLYANTHCNLYVNTNLSNSGWDPLESTCRHASLSIL